MMNRNIPLLIFDILVLPVTITRLVLIYLFGSKYNVPALQFLDVMMHADLQYFNQADNMTSINTLRDDIRVSVNHSSRIDAEILQSNMRSEPATIVITETALPVATRMTQTDTVISIIPKHVAERKQYLNDVKNRQEHEEVDSDYYNKTIPIISVDDIDRELLMELDFLSPDENTV